VGVGNRTRGPPTCSVVPQPSMLPRGAIEYHAGLDEPVEPGSEQCISLGQKYGESRMGGHLRRLTKTKLNSWSESASELYRPSDRRLSAK
jgi:hypothetical protein